MLLYELKKHKLQHNSSSAGLCSTKQTSVFLERMFQRVIIHICLKSLKSEHKQMCGELYQLIPLLV